MPIKIDPEDQFRYFEVPYEPSEEALEAYRRKKEEDSLLMARGTASHRDWGPRPPYEPAVEGDVRQFRETGAEYRPATEEGEYQRFSNDPAVAEDPTVGFIKEPKEKPSPWIGQDMSEESWKKFKQHVVEKQFEGKDWGDVNKYTAADAELEEKGMDKDENPQVWQAAVDRIGKRQDYYFKIMKDIKSEWDKAAAENRRIEKRKGIITKEKAEKATAAKTKYVALGEKKLGLLEDKAKLDKEFAEMRENLGDSPSDEEFGAAQPQMKNLRDRATALDKQLKTLESQMQGIEKDYTVGAQLKPKPATARPAAGAEKVFNNAMDVARQYKAGAFGQVGSPEAKKKAKQLIRDGIQNKGWEDVKSHSVARR
jgi:hypothetical protein